jgi:hypothetical protein
MASVTATMDNHMSTSAIEGQQTKLPTVPWVWGRKVAESGQAHAALRRRSPSERLAARGTTLKTKTSTVYFGDNSRKLIIVD